VYTLSFPVYTLSFPVYTLSFPVYTLSFPVYTLPRKDLSHSKVSESIVYKCVHKPFAHTWSFLV